MKQRLFSIVMAVLSSRLLLADCNLSISDASDGNQTYKCCATSTPVKFKVVATCCDEVPFPLEFTKVICENDGKFPKVVTANVTVTCGHGKPALTTCRVNLTPTDTCDASSSPGDMTDSDTDNDTPLPIGISVTYEMTPTAAPARTLARAARHLETEEASPLKSSPTWRISLGRDGSGNSSGVLELSVMSAYRLGIVTPALVELRQGASQGLDVVFGADGSWRQIMGKECFVQVGNENPGRSFSLEFYEPGAVGDDLDVDGRYVLKVEATPYVVYDIGPVATDGFVRTIPIVERRDGQVVARSGMRVEERPDGTVGLSVTKADGSYSRGVVTTAGSQGGMSVREFVRSGGYEIFETKEYVTAVGRRLLARSVKTVDGELRETVYAYDSQGNMTAKTEPNGLRTECEYDEDGRIVTRREYAPGSDVPTRGLRFSYTPLGVRPHVPDGMSEIDVKDDDGTEEFDLPRVETVYAYGRLVSKTIRFISLDTMNHRIVEAVRLANPASTNSVACEWDNPANARTYTDYMPYDRCKPCSELPSLVMRADGTIDVYAYSAGEYEPGADGTAGVFTDSGCGVGDFFRTVVTHYAAGMTTIPNVTTRDVKIEIRSSKKTLLREQHVCTAPNAYARVSWTATTRDALGQETLVVKSDGTRVEKTYAGRRLASMTDAEGLTTTYTYDALGRVIAETKSGGGHRPDTTISTTYDPEDRILSRTVTSGDLSETETYEYDALGRTVATIDAAGIETRYLYATDATAGIEMRTTIRAFGTDCAVTNTVVYYADGRTKETLLNGVAKTAYEYGPNWTKTYEGPAGLNSPRWSCSYDDALGRTVCGTRPGFRGALLVTSNEYNTANQLVATRTYALNETSILTPLTYTYFCYNTLGQRNLSVEDMNLNNQIDWNDTDRIVSNDVRFVMLEGDWWRESSTWQTRQNGSTGLTLMGRNRTRLTGLGMARTPSAPQGILTAETHSLDALNNETIVCSYLDRATHTTIQTTQTPDSTIAAETIACCGLIVSSRSITGVTTTYAYDALGRQTAQTDGRGNTSQVVYDAHGRVAKTIDPLGNETTYAHDALGRQVAVTDPLGHTITTTYDAEGRVLAQRGATYPVDYTYDAYGNKVSMTTYRNEDLIGGDTTRWLYDEPSGCMTNKLYADSKGPSYSYTPDGKLARRTWARGIATDYSYDNAGQLVSTTYSDATPTITMSYDRVGNLINATTEGVVTNLYAYNLVGNCTNEWQNDFNLTRYYDTLGRSTGYAINGERQTTIAYDSVGRISTMHVPTTEERENVHFTPTPTNYTSFHWIYLPGSDLKQSLTYPNGLTASWQYDANNQLLQVRNATPTNIISQFDYMYDAAGRRVSITKSGTAFGNLSGSIDSYTYNVRSELTSARRTKNGQPIPGFSEDFDYDPIGNRRSSATYNEKGEAQTSTYTANNLNQYTQRTTPGYAAVRGEADPDATVTVNENPTFRLGSYYFGSDLFDNTASGGLANLETYATLAQTAANGEETEDLVSAETNQVYIAQSPETFAYDDDGNQTLITTKTGLWRVTYNGENRPVLWVRDSDNMALTMAYDHKGRRREKNAHRFFYDGYLQVADNGDNVYAWDPSERVATRPLAWRNSALNTPSSALYYAHDGNKNVSEVVASDERLAANYEYTAFGSDIVHRGELASHNPWRYSSEFFDAEIGCDYYNYRHYNPSDGRWISREKFTLFANHVYAILRNRVNSFDCLGYYDDLVHYYLMYALLRELNYSDKEAQEIASGSQYPDTGDWDAVGSLKDAVTERWCPNNTRLQYRELFHNLNSLDCCGIISFRTCLSKKIMAEKSPFNKGIYLHVLADTYAHVNPRTMCSYGRDDGHLEDGFDPDDVQWRINGEEVGKERLYGLISAVKESLGKENVDTPDMESFLSMLYQHNYFFFDSLWWYFYTPSIQIPKYAIDKGLPRDATPQSYGMTQDDLGRIIMPELEKCLENARK